MIYYVLSCVLFYYPARYIYNNLIATRSMSYKFLNSFFEKNITNESDEIVFQKIKKNMKKNEIFWPFMRKFKMSKDPLYVEIDQEKKICMSSYAYLNLQYDKNIIDYAYERSKEYSSGNIGPRMLSGNYEIYSELEDKVSKFFGYEETLVCSSGYMSCASAVIGLVEPGDVILYDSKTHDSLMTGIKISGARSFKFKHNCLKSLENYLILSSLIRYRKKLVILESVYSMDGDVCNYAEMYKICKKYNAIILVDEAHGLGILGETGRGIQEIFPETPKPDIICGTFSKTISSVGGYICSSKEKIELMHYSTPGNMFTAPISVFNAACAIKSFDKLLSGDLNNSIKKLNTNSEFLKTILISKGFNIGYTETCIIPLIFKSRNKSSTEIYNAMKNCIKLSNLMLGDGYWLTPVIYPACPLSKPRIRMMSRIDLTTEIIVDFVTKLEKHAKELELL